jgi:hypothetical protein
MGILGDLGHCASAVQATLANNMHIVSNLNYLIRLLLRIWYDSDLKLHLAIGPDTIRDRLTRYFLGESPHEKCHTGQSSSSHTAGWSKQGTFNRQSKFQIFTHLASADQSLMMKIYNSIILGHIGRFRLE